jgi:hypothetical protein
MPQSAQLGVLIDLTGTGNTVFEYFPASVSEEKQADYGMVDVIARSEPVIGYAHSGVRTCNLEIMFVAYSNVQADVVTKVDFVRSFVYPDYATGGPLPPHIAYLALGDILQMRCVCQSFKVDYDAPYTATPAALPMIARVSTTWYEVATLPWSYDQIRMGLDNRNGLMSALTTAFPNALLPAFPSTPISTLGNLV